MVIQSNLLNAGQISLFVIIFVLAIMFAVIAGIVFVERGQRRLPIHYAKRVVGLKTFNAQTSHLPLKVNMAGVIPPIFASSIIMFPATIANFINIPWVQNAAKSLISQAIGSIIYFLLLLLYFSVISIRL